MKRYFGATVLAVILGGCATFNPFTPSNQTAGVSGGSSLPPQEPVTSDAMYKSTMQPYSVNGIRYEPKVPDMGETFSGIASWYGPNFHGGTTSNGECYDMTTFTAAHKTLPMNTRVKVTNLNNGKSTIVRINDRGPFVDNRIIDLSYAAAKEIGMIKKGTAKVKLEVLDYDTSVDKYKKYEPFPKAVESISKIRSSDKKSQIQPIQKVEISSVKLESDKTEIKHHQSMDYNTKPTKIEESTVALKQHKNSAFPNYEVQIFSSTNQNRAENLMRKYANTFKTHQVKLKEHLNHGRKYYSVLVGNFPTKNHAKAFIINKGFSGALIVKD